MVRQNIYYMDLQELAENGREYCEETQHRKYNQIDGACHENVLGLADYIRHQTEYTPIIVWGVVTHRNQADTADSIQNVSEEETHFWVELEEKEGIVDVHTMNPVVGDNSGYIESKTPYGGKQPDCYNVVERINYYGELGIYDLAHKDHFLNSPYPMD